MPLYRTAEELRAAAHALLLANRKVGTERLTGQPYAYVCPSRTTYPYQWLWDSCFHAIALCALEPALARDELATLLSAVGQDGFLPHVIFWDGRRGREFWPLLLAQPGSRPAHSAQTGPPVVAVAVERYLAATGDAVTVQAWLPAVERYYRWLGRARDWDGDGLLTIIQPYEAGIDASPIYDAPLGLARFDPARYVWRSLRSTVHASSLRWRRDLIRASNGFRVKDLFMTCLYAWNARALARVVAALGGDGATWDAAARRAEQAVLTRCYDPARDAFENVVGRERQAAPLTIAGLAPLLLAGLPEERAARLVEQLSSPEQFWRRYPLPTVAADEPAYNPGASIFLWRGPTWLSTNWLLHEGLRLHGYHGLAADLAERSVALTLKAGFREYYHPDTGAGFGALGFGWSTLAVDLLRALEG
jgi:glycogen debranching enzyme